MADKSTPLMLDALARALAEPAGTPLHGGRAAPGLFAATAQGRAAARQCKDAGYLHVLRTQTRGKAVHEVCAITEQGLQFLFAQLSPRQVLEPFLHALDQRGLDLAELITLSRRCQQTLDGMRSQVQKALEGLKQPVLPRLGRNGAHGTGPAALAVDWQTTTLTCLRHWQREHGNEDCPLTELYDQVRHAAPTLTPGQFHDGLRTLHEQEHIYLHPWTGPLYEIPDPSVALLLGHAVVFYASLREDYQG